MEITMRKHSVIIVGAGVGGATAAFFYEESRFGCAADRQREIPS